MGHKAAISQELMSAFYAFSQDSTSLTESYQRLEQKIDALTLQLSETNQKRLQELAAKEMLAERLTSIIAALPIGLIILDRAGMIIDRNEMAETLLDLNLSDKTWSKIVNDVLADGIIEGKDIRFQNGTSLQINIHNLNQEGRIVMLTDVTEGNRLKEQAANNDKLSVIGEMTAGLVHQIRTPLTSAFLYLERIATEVVNGKVSDEIGITALWKLKESLNTINATVNDLLLFSKDRQSHKECILISEFIDAIQENSRDELEKYNARLLVEFNLEDCEISINRYAMQGAVQNLLTNALQAGCSQIVLNLSDLNGEYFKFTVRDNGCGMTEFEQSKIFSPFFTTKAQGHGLGLSIVKSVIELNGGEIELLESTQNGSCFSIKLPYGDYMKVPLKSNLTIN